MPSKYVKKRETFVPNAKKLVNGLRAAKLRNASKSSIARRCEINRFSFNRLINACDVAFPDINVATDGQLMEFVNSHFGAGKKPVSKCFCQSEQILSCIELILHVFDRCSPRMKRKS